MNILQLFVGFKSISKLDHIVAYLHHWQIDSPIKQGKLCLKKTWLSKCYETGKYVPVRQNLCKLTAKVGSIGDGDWLYMNSALE
eukprot:14433-Heterococcus_DN1.PRE.2